MKDAIAIIPARGGSKRIPRKNIRMFFGKPIIAYSIQAALDSKLFDEVIVSTDDDEIMGVAERYGARPIRRLTLADEHTGTQEVMSHVLRCQMGQHYKRACCIYPTCPMMTADDILRGWHRLNIPRTVYAMSVGTEPLHDPGMWYWGWTSSFKNREPLLELGTGIVPIDTNRVCDINTEEDWIKAEGMYAAWKPQKAVA